MHEILRVMEAAYTPVCRIYPVYRYAYPVIELTRFCMQDEYVNPLFCDPKLFQHPDIFRTDVLGTLAVLGDQPEWLRDCKASMRAAVLVWRVCFACVATLLMSNRHRKAVWHRSPHTPPAISHTAHSTDVHHP